MGAELVQGGRFLVGVDVGTGSARAGVFDAAGTLLGSAVRPISLRRYGETRAEQSSAEIWDAVCESVREAVTASGIEPRAVAGIGFDATCSLVVLGHDRAGLPVGDAGPELRDVIVWMDHRAVEQARRINATGHRLLDYVGGIISPEMEMPKLLWLKEERPEIFEAAWQFMDLTDFLTWKASGSLARSACTVTCKWNFIAHEQHWDEDYLEAIGLGSLAAEGFARIGQAIVAPGSALAGGLTAEAAAALGLAAGTPVAAGLIDAHAGGLGTVGMTGRPSENLAYVFGTSSCTMTTTDEPVFVPGVWGPYYSAMVPGSWLVEGGQTAAGAAIDRLVRLHPGLPEAVAKAREAGRDILSWLGTRAEAMAEAASCDVAELAKDLHVVPEFMGNRAPHADPEARAVIAGLGMDDDEASLVALYIAGLVGVFYGLRQIIEAQAAHGKQVERIVVSGGAARSALVCQLIADATGKTVMVGACEEPVLLGSAMLGAVAGGVYPGLIDAMAAMSAPAHEFHPGAERLRALHARRFSTFEALQAAARRS